MDKEKLDIIADDFKKQFNYFLVALSQQHNCIITAEIANFKVIELEKKDDNDKG